MFVFIIPTWRYNMKKPIKGYFLSPYKHSSCCDLSALHSHCQAPNVWGRNWVEGKGMDILLGLQVLASTASGCPVDVQSKSLWKRRLTSHEGLEDVRLEICILVEPSWKVHQLTHHLLIEQLTMLGLRLLAGPWRRRCRRLGPGRRRFGLALGAGLGLGHLGRTFASSPFRLRVLLSISGSLCLPPRLLVDLRIYRLASWLMALHGKGLPSPTGFDHPWLNLFLFQGLGWLGFPEGLDLPLAWGQAERIGRFHRACGLLVLVGNLLGFPSLSALLHLSLSCPTFLPFLALGLFLRLLGKLGIAQQNLRIVISLGSSRLSRAAGPHRI